MDVHVPVLWPVCSHTIPFRNVVASVTIHDNFKKKKYNYILYICKRCSKKHETIVEGHKHMCAFTYIFNQIHIHKNIYIHIYIYIYISN